MVDDGLGGQGAGQVGVSGTFAATAGMGAGAGAGMVAGTGGVAGAVGGSQPLAGQAGFSGQGAPAGQGGTGGVSAFVDAGVNDAFGSTASMNHITAMHEVSHTLGVGDNTWDSMMVNGIFPGANATAQLRAITGDPTAEVHGDNQHFWPYGLNYVDEVMSERDLIDHCAMVAAIRKDLGYD